MLQAFVIGVSSLALTCLVFGAWLWLLLLADERRRRRDIARRLRPVADRAPTWP
jgi:hypothetical protein